MHNPDPASVVSLEGHRSPTCSSGSRCIIHTQSETCSLLSTAETTHLPPNCNWYQSTSQLPVDCLAALKSADD